MQALALSEQALLCSVLLIRTSKYNCIESWRSRDENRKANEPGQCI